jgi:hypothetical protein
VARALMSDEKPKRRRTRWGFRLSVVVSILCGASWVLLTRELEKTHETNNWVGGLIIGIHVNMAHHFLIAALIGAAAFWGLERWFERLERKAESDGSSSRRT